MYSRMSSVLACILVYPACILLLLAVNISGQIWVGAPREHKCSGQLTILDVKTKTIIHKIVDTNTDIHIDIGTDKKVEISQTGNCCHHVFSKRRCKGESLTLEDNDKYEMKHRGHMTVIKTEKENGSCRTVRDVKNTNVCKIKQKPALGRLELQQQDNFDHTTYISLQDTTEATVDAFNEDIDKSVNDFNQHTDASDLDSTRAISSNEVADTSVVDSTGKSDLSDMSDLSTDVEKVNDQSTEDLDTDSSTAVASSRSGSIAAACVLLAIVLIFVAMLLIYCNKNNEQSCLCHSALGTNTWSPVNKDDFAIDMDDSEFDDKRSIIKNKNKNKNNVYA